MDRYDFMKLALKEAKECIISGDVPVGAVIVKNGQVIATGRNLKEKDNIGVLHAEIVAITNANKVLGSTNLSGCEIYVTLEPCPMCAGAIINSKIDKVIFGAFDIKNGATGSVTNLFALPFTHKPECFGGVMEDECSQILTEFFKSIRK
ncbi:MAG: nucleoside deaminase [Ruminococcus sp.]|nr:nucleoside deaminase [Ruminococcus sp.]